MNKYIAIIVVLVGVIILLVLNNYNKLGISDTVQEKNNIQEQNNAVKPKITGETIDRSNLNLSKVPESIFNQKNTKVLDLSHNSLSGALPSQIQNLQQLQILDLSDNSFTGVPAEIGQLSNLEVLDLSNNPITGLPNELANLKKLKTLDLRGTNYSNQDLEVINKGLSLGVKILVD